jgi:holo-[acyl-carrier protein] synthase
MAGKGDVIVGIGLDLVDIDRFRAALARNPRLADRLFTADERDVHGDGDPAHRLAARFAAKEALMKALGVGLGAFAFHDAEVRSLSSGQPVFELRGPAARLAAARGVGTAHLTMSHTAKTAAAVVVALS